MQFLKKLRVRGALAARSSYGARGWVAHGYVDGFLDTRMPSGDAIIWSDCISCGAWAALALWEDFCYTGNLTTLRDELLPSFRGIAEFFTDHLTTLPGHGDTLFTGPSHSPETSYFVGKSGHTVAFSPAIDLAVLRQVANAYFLGATLLGAAADVSVATAFMELVQRTSSAGLPTVDGQNYILEFPQPFPAARRNVSVNEDQDRGHRHFSSMLWLYPGQFLPSNPVVSGSEVDLHSAALHTVEEKIKHGGGHTGWSAAWEACLWARLGDGARAGAALDKLLARFTSPKFFGLHPPLVSFASLSVCLTCYTDEQGCANLPCQGSGIREDTRGLADEKESLLQLDANTGFLAAVVEMCVQSHVAGYISVLPALPPSWVASGGFVKGLKARGAVQVSVGWTHVASRPAELLVDRLVLVVERPHAWFAPSTLGDAGEHAPIPAALHVGGAVVSSRGINRGGLEESNPGYFRWSAGVLGQKSSEITLIYPLHSPESALVLQTTSAKCGTVVSSQHDTARSAMSVTVSVVSFPCHLQFCGSEMCAAF